MERISIKKAKQIFGKNFIGENELKPLLEKIGLSNFKISIPEIEYSPFELKCSSHDYILILGLPFVADKEISIAFFREYFGINSDLSEPCFYNQDWYLEEEFIHKTLEFRWYLIKKNVIEESRGIQPNDLQNQNINFPSAILCVFTFFAYYYANNEILWYHDFVWCSDLDHNGDRIYVGKYNDIDCINKNGFSIHRYLTLRKCYAAIASL